MLTDHNVHEACDSCLAITTFFCKEDGIACERCYNEETERQEKESKKETNRP